LSDVFCYHRTELVIEVPLSARTVVYVHHAFVWLFDGAVVVYAQIYPLPANGAQFVVVEVSHFTLRYRFS
jgi:hypothetical protein